MDYPVYSGDKVAGTARIYTQGLYTRVEASCEPMDGITRLWLRGEDKDAYIGVMSPSEGRLRISARYTRLEAEALPKRVLYASAGDRPQAKPAATEPSHDAADGWHEGRGCLFKRDGQGVIIALAAELSGPARGVRLERIDGRDYMLFRY